MATKDLDFGNVIKQAYDPALEALQVTVVSGGGSGGATAAKQDEQTAVLNQIQSNTDTIEPALTAANISLDNIEASSAATQASTASIDTKASAIQTATQNTATSTASIDTKLTPLSVLGSFSIDFSSIPSAASAPFEITPGLASATKKIAIYDTTGATIQLRIGATVGTLLMYTGPGQDNVVEALIATSTRVSLRSNGTAPTAGSYIITFLG